MKTEIVKSDRNYFEKKVFELGNIIKDGGLVAFPTETVYGLGGNALDPMAARRIYATKGDLLIIH